ncbi:MAG: hypothetical protein V4692_06060, partial [Bdellovibrionota bacterium]
MQSSTRTKKPDSQKWIVKNGEGEIFGPFTTEQVLAQIDRGYFVGGELIASYPGGQWMAISKTPEFYDRLLDALQEEINPSKTPAPLSDERAEEKYERTEKMDLRNPSVSQTEIRSVAILHETTNTPTPPQLTPGPAIELT